MGGRGATSGATRLSDVGFASPYSRKLSATEVKSKVFDRANQILRNLEQDEAVQIIIRRSFRGGVPTIDITERGLLKSGMSDQQARRVYRSVENWIKRFERDYRSADRQEKAAMTTAEKQEHQAEKETIRQAQSNLKRLGNYLKKNYRL